MSYKRHRQLCRRLSAVCIVLILLVIFPQLSLAASARSLYFDYGSYYNQPKVLGFSFSSIEQLPLPSIPSTVVPVPAGGILPGSFFYPAEQLWENVQLSTTFDPVKREELRLQLASERLSEAKTLMDQGKTNLAAEAVSNYRESLSNLSQNLKQMDNTRPGLQDLATKVEDSAVANTIWASSQTLSSSPAIASVWNDVVRTSTQLLDTTADTRGASPIPQDLSTAIQELKEQGLITPEESDKIYGLSSREQVRAELDKLATSRQFPPAELNKLNEAVATDYPDVYRQTNNIMQFAELRSYQTLPLPSDAIKEEIEKWQSDPSNTPPPTEIRPYLYYTRAQQLAQETNLADFKPELQAEVVKFYPQAAGSNPTIATPSAAPVSPSPSPTPTIASSPTKDQIPISSEATPSATSPTPSPEPNLPTAAPYVTSPNGPLPDERTYFLKQWGEGWSTLTTFDAAKKLELRMRLANERLAEANALATGGEKTAFYGDALKKYGDEVGRMAEDIKNFSGEETEKKDLAQKLEGEVARQNIIFEKGLLPIPPDKGVYTKALESTQDAMDKAADVLERPALPPALANRLQDLKASGLILEEEVANLTKASSREEVRDKIRKMVAEGGFPPADAKKLDEAQNLAAISDFNQLTEVKKVEELQKLRSVQTDLAQTPTLRAFATSLKQRETSLVNTIDYTIIKPEDLAGRADLTKTYQALIATASARPINSGQFGPEATPGAQLTTPTLTRQDAVLSTCPEGATFKQFEGCFWADTGRNINDYDQYRCDGPRRYYSFGARKCVAYDSEKGWNREDTQPICPIGYNWNWQSQSCQVFTGGGPLSLPSPSPEPEPKDEKEITERSKACPQSSSYKPPRGCVWDNSDRPVYDSDQYHCKGRGQYYSFDSHKCVAAPKEGVPYPDDATPVCKETGAYWSWSAGKCLATEIPSPGDKGGSLVVVIDKYQPNFTTPDSPFYFLKQAQERVQQWTAFTPEARENVSLNQAKERLSEAIDALKKDDEAGVKKALAAYTSTMQLLVSDISKAGLSEMAKNEIAKRLSEKSVEHNLLLEKLSAWTPKEQDSAINAAVSVTILGVDKAADLAGEPPIPDEVKKKIESLPEEMISEENKKKLLEVDSRVEARLKVRDLITQGGLAQTDGAFLKEDFDKVDESEKLKIGELKKLEEIADINKSKAEIEEKVEKNEDIVQKLKEFETTFDPGQEVAAEIRPYVRLTRINEVTQTIRPDIVKLEDFANRQDLVLAVATLQQEFKPTKEALKQVEEFRKKNPNAILPFELARIEALSYSLGVRDQTGPCFLPTPLFAPNTPCPAPGAAIPIVSFVEPRPVDEKGYRPGYSGTSVPSVDRDGKSLIYGQGPKPEKAGVCSDGYHWMYDSGGWCMSNSGSYSSSYSYTPTGTGSGYTPYSPYYTAPGAPPATYGYPVGDNSPNDGCPSGSDRDGRGNCIPNSYGSGGYTYTAPSYYGPAPTSYTTYPPSGTVPGSGPKPTVSGQCPGGFHWMSDSGGWCMANGNTYVPGGYSYPSGTAASETPPPGGYNCGSQPYDPVTKKCKDGACPGGFNWDGSKCVTSGSYSGGNYPGTSYYGPSPANCGSGYYWNGYSCQPSSGTGSSCTYPSGGCPGVGAWYDYSSCSCRASFSSTSQNGSSYQYGCTPGYYWDGSKCVAGSYEGSGWSDTAARSGSWCQPPAAGCPGGWYDYSTCSCKSSSSTSSSTTSGGGAYCSPPSGGCGSGWWDNASCSCKISSSQGCYNVSASSCGSGWYFDSAACTCRQSSTTTSTTSTPTSTSTSTSGSSSSSSSGSCPSGYHWMSDNGGWCMSDGGSSSSTTSSGNTSTSTSTTTSTPTESSSPPPSSTTTSTETQSSPPPSDTSSSTSTSTPPSTNTSSSNPAPTP